MNNILVVVLSVFIFYTGDAQITYDASSIPEQLKMSANSVKRSEEISFEVADIDRAYLKVHQVVTLLNKAAEHRLLFYTNTSKYKTLEECEITVFDKLGAQIQRYRKKDLSKQAFGDGLVSEGMYNYLLLVTNSYPLTVEYKYEIKYSGTLFYPDYEIQQIGESVQQSSFSVKVPKELGVRFKQQQINLKPELQDNDKYLTYKWSVADLPALQEEKASASTDWTTPSIIIAPNKFRIYNSSGDMSTWNSFGAWERDLIKDIDVLPEERVAFFKNLVKDAHSERDKVALVYRYLQENFRYVSIQLGIGGYQPFPAKFTDEKKYGDCKGLSFYTYSVLKAIGIKSHVALINAEYNQEPVDPSFPCNSFNHMILCVPQEHDSIWLECTSKSCEFNYLGSSTSNRNALLITDAGGVLVPTPILDPKQNKLAIFTKINLDEDGSGKTTSAFCANGDYSQMLDEAYSGKGDEQKELIVNQLGFRQPDNFTIKRTDGRDMQLDLDIEKIPQFSAGSKMFLSPRIYRFWALGMPSAKDRKQEFFFYSAAQKSDTTVYNLPEGFTVDVLPAAVSNKCDYASYSADYSYNKEKNQLTSTANLVIYKNRIPADKYAEVKRFFDTVLNEESQKMVIKKN